VNADPIDPVLKVKGLGFGWPGRPLFHDLSFDLPPGVSLVRGDDGSGKSTLLGLIAGALVPESGTLSIEGVRLHEQHDAYRHRVFWIDPQTEAHDALAAGGYLDSLSHHYPRFDKDTFDELVDGFGLRPHLGKPMYMLSTGSRRKVWLTAAFSAGTPLTLIDRRAIHPLPPWAAAGRQHPHQPRLAAGRPRSARERVAHEKDRDLTTFL
jgi:ABC-type multidrug transport system ATPase subunit